MSSEAACCLRRGASSYTELIPPAMAGMLLRDVHFGGNRLSITEGLD